MHFVDCNGRVQSKPKLFWGPEVEVGVDNPRIAKILVESANFLQFFMNVAFPEGVDGFKILWKADVEDPNYL